MLYYHVVYESAWAFLNSGKVKLWYLKYHTEKKGGQVWKPGKATYKI
jgi:hypothetical protein